ncbi:DNA helicase MCM8-like [Tubulanus polymorphus]|uniref:DNA helicase MCM8-like n=1 Tax=Tubulanus polymorphus TaxID=672921 RepID=UPI003DA6AA66
MNRNARGRGQWRGNRGKNFYRGRGGRGNYKAKSNETRNRTDSQRTVQTQLEFPSPYKGWKLYFPDIVYSDNSPVISRLETFEKYFLSWRQTYKFDVIESSGYFTVDVKDLLSSDIIVQNIPDLLDELKSKPESLISTIGLAMHQVMVNDLCLQAESTNSQEALNSAYSLSKINARLVNYDVITPLKHLKANFYGKFVSIKGTVIRVNNIKPLCMRLAFECVQCEGIQTAVLPDGKFLLPTSCPIGDCRSRSFNPRRDHCLTEMIDWQRIRVQEIITDDQKESGRIPRIVDCDLTNDLVDSCVPGDMVIISGVVKVTNSDAGHNRNTKDKCMFFMYVQANSLVNTKGSKNSTESSSAAGVSMEFTLKELYAIEEIQSDQNVFRLIVGSLCPTIYGHEVVKAGLVLGLFGGSQKYSNDKNHIPIRGDPHILVVGDPGLGKSQMLQAAAFASPRSVYVCGNTTTTSGLTVTLSKDSGSDYGLEAGALVLADQGCCCIDEFDKMGNQHQALLEAMEQQSISIAKAGIVCSLPARSSILAAANPVGGHYNKAKTVSENLKMGSALLSRFDLVFIMLDRPDEQMDTMLSDHVMAMHSGKRKRKIGADKLTVNQPGNDESKRLWDSDKSLSERLQVSQGEQFDPIPLPLLRKYVGYARKYVHPKISPEAAKILQKFYLELRKNHHHKDSTPITTRQLESLMRLTEARARLELREVCIEQDALDVIEIMKESMVDTYSNELGFLDYQRSQHGSGMSSRSQAKKLVALMQTVAERTYNSLFTTQHIRQLTQEANLKIKDLEGLISSLNNQGYLLQKGPRVYQLQTSAF